MTNVSAPVLLSFLCWTAFLQDVGLSFSLLPSRPCSNSPRLLEYSYSYCPNARDHLISSLSSSTRSAEHSGRSLKSSKTEGLRLSRGDTKRAMDLIWKHTQSRTRKGAATALEIMTQLLEEEERRTEETPIIKQGVVFNVLKSCRHLGSPSRTTADLLEKAIGLLEGNARLWDASMIPYMIGLLTKLKSQSSMIKAQTLLRDLESHAELTPTIYTYTTMLRCYANRGMVDEAEELLRRMYDLHKSGSLDQEPDKVALKCVKDARRRAKSLSRKKEGGNTTNTAESSATASRDNFPLFVLDEHASSSAESRLDDESYQHAVNTIWWHIRKDPETSKGVEKALRLLNRLLLEEEKESNSNESRADKVLKGNLVFNLLRSCAQESTNITVRDLETTFGLLEGANNDDLMNEKVLRELLIAVSRCPGDADAPRRAADMLARTNSVIPNSYHYNAVLMGFAKRGWADKAEALLKEMQSLQKAGTLKDGPNAITYNVVLDALSKSGESDAVNRAEVIWKRMMKNAGIKPDMFTFTSLFSLYAQNAQGDKAERLLVQVAGLHKAGKLEHGPNVFTYRCVIDALAKSATPERAEEILYRMQEGGVEPNRFHYCSVLGAYARNGEAAQCERLLQRMYDSYVAGSLPDAPDVIAFNSVVYAWAKSGADDALSKAKGVADDMTEAGIPPNVITYNCLLSAVEDGKEAEEMLKQMHELHASGELETAPNTISYNYCLNALAASEMEWTVVRAESLVNEMRDLYQSGEASTKPNMITYRSLIKCYAKWNLAEDAEQLLQTMQTMFEGGELEYGPDKITYNLVIDMLRNSDAEGSTERAETLHNQFEELYGAEQVSDSQLGQPDQIEALLEYMGGFGLPSFL